MQKFIQKTADLTFPLVSGRAHECKRLIKLYFNRNHLLLKSAVYELVNKQLKYDFLTFK